MSLIQLAELEERMRKLEADMDRWKARRRIVRGGGMTQHDQLYNLLKDVHTQYLPLTGKRVMTGDLDMGTSHILFENARLRAPTSECLQVRTRDDTAFASLYLYRIFMRYGFEGVVTPVYMRTDNLDAGEMLFQGWDSGGRVTAAKIAANSIFDIPRAGDITLLAGKSIDAYTNAGFLKPRRISQALIPTPEVGEVLLWRNTTLGQIKLVYNDPVLGVKSVQLI